MPSSFVGKHDKPRVNNVGVPAESGCDRFDLLEDAWTTIDTGAAATPAQLGRLTLAGQQAMDAAITAVDIAFGHAGAGIVYAGHPLERCFRDIHTANQHIAFSGEAYTAYARGCFNL